MTPAGPDHVARPAQGQRGPCQRPRVCQRGLLAAAEFYILFIVWWWFKCPTLPNHKQKEALIWLLSARRIKVIFFLGLFFFFLQPQYLGRIPVQVITFCLPKFPCNTNWASCSPLPSSELTCGAPGIEWGGIPIVGPKMLGCKCFPAASAHRALSKWTWCYLSLFSDSSCQPETISEWHFKCEVQGH